MTARIAIVTGASSGIGLATVQRLLVDGWAVKGLSRTAPPIDAGSYTHVSVDLSDPDATASALGSPGQVHAVVHAAGILRVGKLADMDRADGARMWRLHVDCAAQLLSHLSPAMEDGGRFVLIGSRVSDGVAGRSLYAATKAALSGLARSAAAELAPRRITVNIVAPGATDTPMLRDPARSREAPRLPPMGRFVTPEEVASLTAFLLSQEAASITGQRIVVCGGASV